MSETEWKTIRVPKPVWEDAQERKDEYGVTWGQYVNPHAWHCVFDEPNEEPRGSATGINVEELKDEISMAADPAVQVDTESIINRLDDLEAELPRKVAEELQR